MGKLVDRAERDGDGFPGGIRLSWSAISALIAVLLLFSGGIGIVNGMILKRIDAIEQRLEILDQRLYEIVRNHGDSAQTR